MLEKVHQHSHSGKQGEGSLELKAELHFTTWPSNPTPGHLKERKPPCKRAICTPVFIPAIFTTGMTWEQPKCQCQLDKESGVHTVNDSTIRKAMRPCVTWTWRTLPMLN
jgi:hypothetical protein